MNVKLAELESESLRAQMNPHFVFNALNSIQSFIAVGETMRSEVYLSKFSNLLRKTLQNSRQKTIPLAQELENVEIYLELEKMRFEDKLKYTLEIDPALETELIHVPPMLLQPFIENAIVHGLAPKPSGGTITIKIDTISEELIRYTIQDDGVGRKNTSTAEHVSLGTDIVRQRLSLYHEIGKNALIYDDLVDERGEATGTKVELKVPVS
ncbi:MAG: histidine kinase [Flavobacteriaceae bacterium]|nr:histidine kinase [Flavobacteriaceae bacterium]